MYLLSSHLVSSLFESPPFLLIAVQPLHYILCKWYLLIVSPRLLIIIVFVLPELRLLCNYLLVMLCLIEVTSAVQERQGEEAARTGDEVNGQDPADETFCFV
jgi:hypothetical protein